MDRGPTRMGHWSTIARSLEVTGPSSPWGENFSWGGRTRTSNFPVNSRAVCQLTYTPKGTATQPHTVTRLMTRRLQCQTPSGEQESGVRKTCAPGTIGCRGRAFTVTARYAAPAPRFGRLALALRFAPRPANVRIGLTH